MQIKDVIMATATFLGREDVVDYLNSASYKGDEIQTVDKLVRLTNLVISEISVSFVSAVTTQEINFSGGKAEISGLYYNPLKILKVVGKQGEQLEFSTDGVNLYCNTDSASVIYEYYPTNMGLSEQITFAKEGLTVHVLAMGVAAEYCLTVCDFDSAVVWHERFVDQLKKLVTLSNVTVKQRAWL